MTLNRVFFHPDENGVWRNGVKGMELIPADFEAFRDAVERLLPPVLQVSSLWDACVITRRPEDLARRLLELIRGEAIEFGRFAKDIEGRPEIAVHLSTTIRPGHLAWEGIKNATNPAAYLNTTIKKLLEEYDVERSEHEECRR